MEGGYGVDRVRLDGRREGDLGQQTDDGGGFLTMWEI